jgi:hypothetical protein
MYSCKGVIIGVSCKEYLYFSLALATPSHLLIVSAAKIPNVQPQPDTSSPCLYQRTYQIKSRRYCLWPHHNIHPRAVPSANRPEGISILTHVSEILTLKLVALPLMVVQVQPTEEVQVLHDVRSTNIVSILSIATREARKFQNVRRTACR